MNTTYPHKKGAGKAALAALAMIATSALLFGYFSQSVLAADLGKPQAVPPSYAPAPAGAALPAGYQKADYAVTADPLASEAADAQAIPMEEAAELGAQALWELFGADLGGATVYMSYCSGTETFPRAFWSGDVRFGSSRTPQDPGFSFSLDAVTGERFGAAQSRILSVELDLGLDAALAENPQEYLDLARQLAAEKNLVHGQVEAVSYNCQGYSCNDPDITLNVLGANGEKALVTFSRYDQQLKGVGYDAERRIREPALEKLDQELEKRIEAARAAGGAGGSGLAALEG